jgi:hypothetical protein
MTSRPTSITVIGWLLIVMGVLGALGMIMVFWNADPKLQELLATSPVPVPFQYAMSFAGLVITVACGYFMLQGQNWARLLYVIWSASALLTSLLTSPIRFAIIPSLVFFLLITIFLFRPKANAFFAGARASFDAQNT